jgi:Ca-activated chloride channel family protein
MPNGRSSAVRSHRRTTPKRRVLPWVIIPLVLVLLGAGGIVGYQWYVDNVCSGKITATIVTTPRTAALLRPLASSWTQTDPQIDRVCASVDIQEQETSLTAKALSEEWAPGGGQMPDVWVPQSSAWARAAAASSAIADRIMPDRLPSVARTPLVIAMPKALAETFGWPESQLEWKDLLDKLAGDGTVKIGMSDPATSTVGLLALSSIIDANDDTDVDAEEFKRVYYFQQRVAVYKSTSEELFAEYLSGAGQTLTAFPAFEQDVVKHNEENPSLPLVAVYPKNATTEADHPFLQFTNAPWTDKQRQSVAEAFLLYLKGEAGRNEVLAQGFRDSNRTAGPELTPAMGVVTKLTALPRAVLLPDAISRTVTYWNGLTRPSNVLLVLDVSGSMGNQVPGTGQSKLDLTKGAAAQAVGFFGDKSSAGLWSFSSAQQQSNQPYRELVKTAGLSEPNQRKKLNDELGKLVANGNTGMYDTVWAAHQHLQANYRPDAENLVVLLTDGADDDQLRGLQLAELIERLKGADPAKPVKIVTIALGRETDSEALTQVSTTTGVRSYSAARTFDISAVLMSAIFDVR